MAGRVELPPLSDVMDTETGDFSALTLLENIVTYRIEQVMDASPWELGLTVDDLEGAGSRAALAEWAQIRAMLELAYRTGLKDGLVRLGDM